jgi:hypothetical protein
MRSLQLPPLAKLATAGAVVGTACDALHNQAILSYDLLPVRIDLGVGVACTSLIVPPLLALAYVVIGDLFPRLARRVVCGGQPALRDLSSRQRALLAVLSTACIIRASEALATTAAPDDALGSTSFLYGLALLEWLVLDGSWATLVLAVVVSVGGPLAELPFLFSGAWHYLEPNAFPLELVGVLPSAAVGAAPAGGTWDGLDTLTGPCYFAVCTDSVALGSWFRDKEERED